MANENVNQGKQQQKGTAQGGKVPIQVEKGQQAGEQPTGLTRQESYLPSLFGGGFGGSPFGLMRRMMDDMDRMFEDFGFGRSLMPSLGGQLQRGLGGALWAPQVDVLERDGKLVVRADLPGIKQEDLEVEVLNDTLILQGERKSELEEEKGGVYRSERSYGSFRREIPLPEGIDVDQASASFENGVLEISMKLPQSQAKRIEVTGGQQAKGTQGEQKAPMH